MENTHFSTLTLIEAVNVLRGLTQAEFDKLMLHLCMESCIPQGYGMSVENKANKLAQFAKSNPNHQTASESNLLNEIVEYAASHERSDCGTALARALARDGFTMTSEGAIKRALPEEIELPKTEDEVHMLLTKFAMNTAKGHLDQAIENHTKGNWASANSQLRTFLEGMFDEIARQLYGTEATGKLTSENKRQWLAEKEPAFLQKSLGEWDRQGKNFTNGVFKRLHSEGSHPGLSDEDDSTFRLHLVLVVARHYLRRLCDFKVTAD